MEFELDFKALGTMAVKATMQLICDKEKHDGDELSN